VALLFDREVEVRAGSRFLAAARESGAALVVEGSAGIGKSAFVRAIAKLAGGEAFEVLSCGGLEGETELDYASLSELIAPLVDAGSPGLPPPQRTALEIVLARVEPGEMTPDRLAISLACARLFEAASRLAPLLVLVDDEQWLDAATREVLRIALRHTAAHPVGWLVARRTDELGPAPLDAERALPDEAVTRIQLGAIGRDGVSRLVTTRVVGPWSPATIEEIFSASGGNPLAAIEIARDLRRRSAASDSRGAVALALPASLADALRARVANLSLTARSACEAASILPRAPYAAVATLAGDATTGIAEAEDAEMLVRESGMLAFTHPLLRLAIDEGLTRPRRATLHLRAAGIVSDPVEQALHLALGHVDPDAGVAERAAAAAGPARERNAIVTALTLLEHSLRLTPPDERELRDARRAALAEALLVSGEYDRARALLADWLPGTPHGASRAKLLMTRHYIHFDHDQGLADLAEAADNAAADPALRVWIELSTSMVAGLHRNTSRGIEHASRARAIAAEVGDVDLEATAASIWGGMASLAGETGADRMVEEAVERAPEPTNGYDIYLQPRMAAGLVALWAGRLDVAETHLGTLWRAMEERGAAQHTAFVALHMVELCWRTGEWARGFELAETISRFDAEAGDTEPGAAAFARSMLLASQGEAARARAIAERGMRTCEAAGDRIFALQNRVILGFIESSIGDHAAALRWLEPLPAMLDELGVRNPGAYPFAPDMLEALVTAGRVDDAERLVRWVIDGTGTGDHPWARSMAARGRGLIMLARGEHESAVAALREALSTHDELRMPLERGRALLLLGSAQRRARRRSDAAATLERAVATFRELGASSFEARTQDERRRLGVRSVADDELTPTEHRVAELVAEGLTNREVAAALFMSTKTVEANLTRIYRSLGLRSRSELARRFTRG
jgi:DNA-binding NarL/FixJ family response regulator